MRSQSTIFFFARCVCRYCIQNGKRDNDASFDASISVFMLRITTYTIQVHKPFDFAVQWEEGGIRTTDCTLGEKMMPCVMDTSDGRAILFFRGACNKNEHNLFFLMVGWIIHSKKKWWTYVFVVRAILYHGVCNRKRAILLSVEWLVG